MRDPVIRSNMNGAQMERMLAMMAASGQEYPLYTTGQPAITGFRYNGSGWLGSRPVPTRRQLRSGRDNMNPIYDTGPVVFPSDFGTPRFNTPINQNQRPGSGFPDLGGIFGGLIDKLTDNILKALEGALGRMAVNINLNSNRISDAETRILMRRIDAQF